MLDQDKLPTTFLRSPGTLINHVMVSPGRHLPRMAKTLSLKPLPVTHESSRHSTALCRKFVYALDARICRDTTLSDFLPPAQILSEYQERAMYMQSSRQHFHQPGQGTVSAPIPVFAVLFYRMAQLSP